MQKILILGNNSLTQLLKQNLISSKSNIDVQTLNQVDFTKDTSYTNVLKNVSTIVSFLGPLDVDLDFEALFDAIRSVQSSVDQFVMLSTAGIDHEVDGQLEYPHVKNVKEYLNQQRYAAKVLDESEIPYTILRPTKIVKHTAGNLVTIPEGQPIPAGSVSVSSIVSICNQIVLQKKFIGESLGMVDQ